MRLRHPPAPESQKQAALESKRNSYTLTALPLLLGQCHFWLLQWEKRTQDGDNQPPPALWWPHEDFRRICGAQPPGIWLWGGREESSQQPAQGSWPSSHLWSQVANPTGSFVHLQNQVGGAHWPGNLARECRSAWFRSSERFCWPWSRVCPVSDEEWNHSPAHYRQCLLPPSDWKGWRQHLQVVPSSSAWVERWAGKANSLQSKATAPLSQGTWDVSQPELRQQRAWPVLKLLLPLHPGTESNSHSHSLLNIRFSLSDQGNFPEHTGSCTAHSTVLFTAVLEQRVAPHICRARLPDSANQGIQSTLRLTQALNELSSPWVSSCCLARAGKLIHSPIYCESVPNS